MSLMATELEIRNLQNVYRLLHPKLTVLVVSVDKKGNCDVMAAAWAMPISSKPPIVGVSIAPKRKTWKNIRTTGEFVLSIPTMDMLDKVWISGTISANDVADKFKKIGFETQEGIHIKVPHIKGSVANIECRVCCTYEIGDHILVGGEVLGGRINNEVYNEKYIYTGKGGDLIFHLGGDRFISSHGDLMIWDDKICGFRKKGLFASDK